MVDNILNHISKVLKFDAHYFIRGGFWLTITQIIAILGGLLSSVLFAFYLTPHDFGVYRYLIGLAALLSAVSLTGLSQSILQTAAKKYYAFYTETIKTNLFYSIGIFLTSITGSAYYFIQENYVLSLGCLFISILSPITLTFGNISPYLQGAQRYKDVAITQTFRTVLITCASVVSVLLTNNVIVLFLTFLFSAAATNLIIHFLYQPKDALPTPEIIYYKYRSYAIHTSIRNLVSNIANRADTIIVFTQLGSAELALYSIAALIPEQIKSSFNNFANLLLPKYARHTDVSILKKGVPKRSFQLFILLLIISALYIFSAPFFYELLFPKYQNAILYSQLLALAFPSFVFLIPYNLLQANLEQNKLHYIIHIGSFFQIIITLTAIYTFGIVGAIISKIMIRYFYMFITYYYFYK